MLDFRDIALRAALCSSLLLGACGDDASPASADSLAPDASDTPDAVDTSGAPDAADTSGAPDAGDTSGAPDSGDTQATTFCEGTTTFAWDPTAGRDLVVFPDDALTRDDDTTLTGLRVSLGDPTWLSNEATVFQPLWRQLEDLDGFGTSAGIVLRFSAPIAAPPGTAVDSIVSDAIQLWDLGAQGEANPTAARVAYEAQVLDEGATVILWPIRPLREMALHAAVVTTAHKDAAGGCIAPSAPLRALLSGASSTDPAVTRLASRYATFSALVDHAPGDVSALTLFTTQAITPVTLSQRAEIRAGAYKWKDAPTCKTTSTARECVGTFIAKDFRREGYLGTPKQPETYLLPVHVWLPKSPGAPAPVLVFGHGLGGDAEQADVIAELSAQNGLATVALAAPRHGDHPTANRADPNAVFTDLFGIDLDNFTIDGFVFRENVRQAAFDKLQALELLTADADVDGDGEDDLDLSRVAYWGISLGGIMGPDFTALSDQVDLAVYSIAGSRVLSIVTEGEAFGAMRDLLAELAGGEDALLRTAAIAQSLIDAGDPINWAARVGTNRVDDAPAPHVLLQMVMGDEIVPNGASIALARALDVPQVPPILRRIDPLRAEAQAPVTANATARTHGLFQLDRVSRTPGGAAQVATHNGVFNGIEAIDQVQTFLEGWLLTADHVPWIIDPYAENGTPPLP